MASTPGLCNRALLRLVRRQAEVKTTRLRSYTIYPSYLRLSKFSVSLNIALKIRSTNE